MFGGGRRLVRVAVLLLVAAALSATAAASAAGGRSAWRQPPQPPAFDPNQLANALSSVLGHVSQVTGGRIGFFGHRPLGSAAPGAVGASTLVLYDTTGDYGWLGELYATYAGNLASHFGTWKAEPVSSYQAGQISQYTATIYIGSTYDEPLPTAFLDDVYDATNPVVWIYDNIWELTNRYPDFATKYGWMWSQFDLGPVSQVVYRGVTLTRDATDNQAGIMAYSSVDPTKATVLATAVHDDGTTFPWALRSGELTYIGENPFVYTSETDRVIAFDDLLYDVLDPAAPTRHRAMVRLEDINPSYDPAQLKAVADYLYSQGIPFGFGVFPVYTDPLGVYNNGVPELLKLTRSSQFAATIRYLQAHGGTLVEHGYTHQYQNVANPYTGVSGDDFEFYRAVENPDHTLSMLGPVPNDSELWAAGRIGASFLSFLASGVTPPTIFEFPHYMASVPDYQAAAQLFPTRWERGVYFGGYLSGGKIDYSHVIGETFPYVVRDAYGSVVLPENLGAYSPEPFYQFPVHGVDAILDAGRAELAVRDGIAAFYYHPFEGVDALKQIVSGLQAEGYTFVAPTDVARNG